ncbi:M24 family metallopeptidase [Candidatus Halobonum tyrrellensis]|uniref:Xaa-pro aminopeptidase n=1 Tax=Candidatus Halobonum tyrrellensis G22 TaxID=1324957 RepID=V4HIM8_9EURY|nr:M24 family metallopeptidase [Candidatus Halobonum tyrrellensis]ESP87784.1 xaa-pro aminopeptidase [Candidatus Halobonum tyrrellensis G22]
MVTPDIGVDIDDREARLDDYLAETGNEAVWFGRPAGFAWLTGGSNWVDAAADVGDAAVGYAGDGDWTVVTNNIEAERIAAEELPAGLSMSVAADDWYDAGLAESVAARSPTPAAADFDVPGLGGLNPTPLRLRLADSDVERYRALGTEAAVALESVCRELEPGDTEHEVAAAVRIALASRNIDAPVVLVGGSERAQEYRHPTPTDAPLGDYALVVLTARRAGLHASLTRTVAFDPPGWLAERHAAAQRVETRALAATRSVAREGGTAGEVFDEIREAYADEGYEGEWRHHHQGGATGYAGREWFAEPGHDGPVAADAAYAWNPTVQGAKSEDTAVVRDEEVEVLTSTGEWPTDEVTAGGLTLDRPAVYRP